MKTEYDKELLEDLKDEIMNRSIATHDDVSAFINDLEETFPFSSSSIDWNNTNTVHYIKIFENDMNLKNAFVDHFLELILREFPELAVENVIVLGDLTNLGYEMRYDLFIKLNDHFFSLPQDTYIWFPKSRKCINYTFEDELFFG